MSFLFESDRFGYRETQPEDAEAMFNLNADPEVLRYTGDEPFSSIDEAREFLTNYSDFRRNGMGRWAIVSKETQAVIGWAGLKKHDAGFVDLGYRLLKSWWGKGVATEASLASLKHGFEALGLKEIVARSVPENIASIRVMDKCGFVFSHRESDELHGQEIVVYTITHEDFSRH